jgi:hypothetical protein
MTRSHPGQFVHPRAGAPGQLIEKSARFLQYLVATHVHPQHYWI